MRPPEQIIAAVLELGAVPEPTDDGRLRVRGLATLPAELQDEIRRHRDQIRDELRKLEDLAADYMVRLVAERGRAEVRHLLNVTVCAHKGLHRSRVELVLLRLLADRVLGFDGASVTGTIEEVIAL